MMPPLAGCSPLRGSAPVGLPKRFAKYGLTLHPEKTRLLEFRRPPRAAPPPGGVSRKRPATFEFLGFTHLWGRSHKGNWTVRRQTSPTRFGRALKRVSVWCKHHRHDSIGAQHHTLVQQLRGHFGYFGIIGNFEALQRFRFWVIRAWRKWLSRRSGRSPVTWERMLALQERYPLPAPRIVQRPRLT